MKSKYTKMQSNGNDFLITEDIKLVSKTKELSDRIKNIGFDQLLFFQNKEIPILQVFNADGSEADNCVNGLRCIAFLYGLKNTYIKIKKRSFYVNKTKNGAVVRGSFPQIKKIHDWYVINFGNNHIAKSCEDIEGFDLKSAYKTERDNILFNSVDNFNMSIFKICENSIKIRTYENGTGETLSCGSATISVAYALSFELGLNELTFKSLGGETKVYISNDGVASEASAEIIEEGFLNG